MATRGPLTFTSKNAAGALNKILLGEHGEGYRICGIEYFYVDPWPNSHKNLKSLCQQTILEIWFLFTDRLLKELMILISKKNYIITL